MLPPLTASFIWSFALHALCHGSSNELPLNLASDPHNHLLEIERPLIFHLQVRASSLPVDAKGGRLMILGTSYNLLGGPHWSLCVDDVLAPHNERGELVESQKQLVDVQDFRKITNHFRGI